MGLIKEPVEIDFTVLSKVWTDKEEKEFSELIKMQKEEHSKHKMRVPLSPLATRHSTPVVPR